MDLPLHISDYNYLLPAEKIAQYPAAERDFSKVLVYRKEQAITHDRFNHVLNYIAGNSLVVFNNTRVIHARILFTSNSGSTIEVFCLRPIDPEDYETVFNKTGACIWECLVGNSGKWKSKELKQYFYDGRKSIEVRAEMLFKTSHGYHIRFSWSDSSLAFGDLLERTGIIPLPPYIKRQPLGTDNYRYQTVYARNKGSVAAPTAGLHFTEDILQQLQDKNIRSANVTLHVGAGTFLPVKVDRITDHPMHAEEFTVSIGTLEMLLTHTGPLVAVGTTTVRALESLFWLGMKLIKDGSASMELDQWEHDHLNTQPDKKKSLKALCDYLMLNNQDELTARTRIMIIPGYKYRLVDQLITNFHQPRSTLLLLVAAFIGEDWKKVYQYALDHDFRFLSYGDSSLLIP